MEKVNYEFYQNTYGGRLDRSSFDKLLPRARFTLDHLTFGRLWQMEETETRKVEAVNMALCATLDRLASDEKSGGREIVSEAVGEHRVGYAHPPKSSLASMRKLVAPYLDGLMVGGAPLCYRGKGGGKSNGL